MPAFDRFARPLKTTAALAIIAGSMVWMSFSIYGLVARVDESRAAVLPIYSDGAIRSPEPAAPKESSTPQPAEPSAKAIPTPSVKQDEGVPPLPKLHDFRDDYHNRVCAGGLDAANEIHIDPTKADHYTVKLTPGCFSPLIYVPKEWERWTFQVDGDGWIGYVLGSIGTWGPMTPEAMQANKSESYIWTPENSRIRLQGDGSATVYKFKTK